MPAFMHNLKELYGIYAACHMEYYNFTQFRSELPHSDREIYPDAVVVKYTFLRL